MKAAASPAGARRTAVLIWETAPMAVALWASRRSWGRPKLLSWECSASLTSLTLVPGRESETG